MMTVFERLQKRIEKDLGIRLVNFRRTYAGYWQKVRGGWVWGASYADSGHDIGSIYRATDLLKSKKLNKIGFPYSDEIDIDE